MIGCVLNFEGRGRRVARLADEVTGRFSRVLFRMVLAANAVQSRMVGKMKPLIRKTEAQAFTKPPLSSAIHSRLLSSKNASTALV
jgi:hypothetical protein